MTFFRILLLISILLASAARAERTVVQALTDTEIVLDPVYSSDASAPVVVDSLFDTLVAWDAAGRLVPAGAVSWEISPDNLVYTFHLGPENRWSDGTPVVAEDFVAAFRRFVDPATHHRMVIRYLLDPVVNATAISAGEKTPDTLGVRAIDDHTLEITLVGPTGYFLEIMAQPPLSPVPRHVLAAAGDKWADPANLVSNGPYLLKLSEPGHIVMERNEAFRMRPEPDRLEFLFVKSTTELMRLLASGKVDIVLTLPQKEVVALQSSNWVKSIALETSPGTTYLSLNTTKPPLDDLRVRQAVDLAIDREVLNRAQNEYTGVVATTFTSPSLFTYVAPPAPPAPPPYGERLVKARNLLAEAGFDDANPLRIELLRRVTSPQSQPAFVGIRSMLGQLPIQIETFEVDRKELLRRLTTKEFDAAILTWQADYNDPMTFLSLFRAGGFANFSGWANPVYQALLEKALTMSGRKAREELYVEMEELIRDDVPIIPLRHSSISIVSSRNLLMPRLVNGIIYPRLVRFLDE